MKSLLTYLFLALVISGIWVPQSGIVLGLAIGGLFIFVIVTEYRIVRNQKSTVRQSRS